MPIFTDRLDHTKKLIKMFTPSAYLTTDAASNAINHKCIGILRQALRFQ